MVFEHIEQLKREYTDKYVIVDATQPELRRFEGQTGVVKTVNMNGNALVEFDAYQNIGWYDISLDFLKVIDQPLPKPEPQKAAPKAKKAAPAKDEKPAAKAGGGMSVAEMLAAARGEKGAAPAKKEAAPEKKPASQPAGDSKGMSVAEMLAAARAEKSAEATEAAPEAQVAETSIPETEPTVDSEPAAETPASDAPVGDLPKDIPGILAYCRKVDG